MKIILNNDMEMILDNKNGNDVCIASLVDSSDGDIICAAVIDEQELFEFLASKMPKGKDIEAINIAEERLKKAD